MTQSGFKVDLKFD